MQVKDNFEDLENTENHSLPEGPIVVPFWDNLIGFKI